jgi:hypothetical protein
MSSKQSSVVCIESLIALNKKLVDKITELEKENITLRAVLPRYITESDIDKMRDEGLKEKGDE